MDCTSCVLVLLNAKIVLEFKTQPVGGHKRQIGKRGVAGSIHDGDIYFHFGIFACFPFLTTR